MADDPMWLLVMFDLPVKTQTQRKLATYYRQFLLDHGFGRVQFSVYVRYFPTGGVNHRMIKLLKLSVPPQGQLRILSITDRQWANMIKILNSQTVDAEETPHQLQIF